MFMSPLLDTGNATMKSSTLGCDRRRHNTIGRKRQRVFRPIAMRIQIKDWLRGGYSTERAGPKRSMTNDAWTAGPWTRSVFSSFTVGIPVGGVRCQEVARNRPAPATNPKAT
ncbi:hypothetical protein QN224_15630 [Sinorhizobium sp. 8-89]|nr:hypothetical protein [Sinorhizobium sp. 7-81]MDK1386840.1 hypothetical protein [Sinorhizobium sp. 7-81]